MSCCHGDEKRICRWNGSTQRDMQLPIYSIVVQQAWVFLLREQIENIAALCTVVSQYGPCLYANTLTISFRICLFTGTYNR